MVKDADSIGDVAADGMDRPVALQTQVPFEVVDGAGEARGQGGSGGDQVDALGGGQPPLTRQWRFVRITRHGSTVRATDFMVKAPRGRGHGVRGRRSRPSGAGPQEQAALCA
jgi:hypothetical protein